METPMENRYNIWNKWDPLKVVVLGDTYKPEFYDGIKDDNVRDVLLRICEETLEDLEYYEKVLKDFGCKVLRPKMNLNDNIMNYVDDKGRLKNTNGGIPRPPLFPRDSQFVLGNNLVFVSNEPKDVWVNLLTQYNDENVIDLRNRKTFSDRPRTIDKAVIHAPCYTVVGRDVYIDIADSPINEIYKEKLLISTEDIRLNYLRVGGHSDGCFHTIKPGAILTLHEIQRYENTFPNWDLCYLKGQSWSKISGFLKMKQNVRGKWWVPGEEDNIEFTLFVENWLDNWVGYVEETVFDVNVLVLDEHHVCVNNPNNEQVNAFLKKHKMEAIHIPWRHRYFHDGGLHCLTLDLYREGHMIDYFPERGNVVVIDHGFD
jgi:hypothetical protein